MRPPIQFFVQGTPKPQPRPRAFARQIAPGKWMARAYDAGTAEGWKSQIAEAAKPFIPEAPWTGPIRLLVTFNMPRPKAHFRSNGTLKDSAPHHHIIKPDSDNLIKAVRDCLTLLSFWRDDCQICNEHVMKTYAVADYPGGASITIQELAEE